jgi:hypothetical protein
MDLCRREFPIAGPLPVLFSEQPQETITTLQADPQPLVLSLEEADLAADLVRVCRLFYNGQLHKKIKKRDVLTAVSF